MMKYYFKKKKSGEINTQIQTVASALVNIQK